MNDKIRNIVSTLGSIVLFLILFMSMKWNIFVSLGLSAASYFGIYLVTKPQLKLGNVEIEALENGLELKELMDEANRDLKEIDDCTKKIKDYTIKNNSSSLYVTGNSIVNYLKENPSKISKSRRFLNYYLETSKNIILKYYNIEKSNVATEELKEVGEKTNKALTMLHSAFKKHYMKLNTNEIMDIEADIKLLETTLMEE